MVVAWRRGVREAFVAARRDRSWQRSLVVDGVVLGAAAVVVAVTGAFAVVAGVDGAVLTREPQVTLDGPVYAGFLSNLGALVWMVGVTVAAIGWVTAVDPARRALFLAGTAIGAILLFDDFFLFHEWLDTLNSELDTVVLAGYLVLVVWLLVHHRRPLGAVGVTGIGGTLGLLALSAAIDQLFNDLDQLIEDGFKFLGICLWSTTWVLLVRPRGGQSSKPT